MKSIEEIQAWMKKRHWSAWVIADAGCKNPALISLFGKRNLTRRLFFVLPADKEPYFICSKIDGEALQDCPFRRIEYRRYEELLQALHCLEEYPEVAMEMSENGCLPKASIVDYGTVCLIKQYVPKIISSADLLQMFSSTLTDEELIDHQNTVKLLEKIKDEAFVFIKSSLHAQKAIHEYDVQQFISSRMEEEGLITDAPAIVAVNGNASNPHYTPTKEKHTYIQKGDVVLIDLWAKKTKENSVYGDLTWMGYVGKTVPEEIDRVFRIVQEASRKTVEFLQKEIPLRSVKGYEADDICRNYIQEQGYGDYFIHRTGHNIAKEETPHGPGVNLDHYETKDDRCFLDHTIFSVEPGIYLPNFGIRLELDVMIQDGKVSVTGSVQKDWVLLD